jgi:hypothetical protein
MDKFSRTLDKNGGKEKNMGYRWKDDESDFIVYGFEKKVYAPNYPQQFCCGCSVL